jgi:hypothetical protein
MTKPIANCSIELLFWQCSSSDMLLNHSCLLSVFLCFLSIFIFPWSSQLTFHLSLLSILFLRATCREFPQLWVSLVINPPPIASRGANKKEHYNSFMCIGWQYYSWLNMFGHIDGTIKSLQDELKRVTGWHLDKNPCAPESPLLTKVLVYVAEKFVIDCADTLKAWYDKRSCWHAKEHGCAFWAQQKEHVNQGFSNWSYLSIFIIQAMWRRMR